MKVKLTPVESIIPYARNPRQNAAAVDKVAASIKEFGFQQPIVCDGEMVVIAGHTRLLAAKQLGLSKVPVVVADHLTPAQVKAYRLADNRVAQEASWDQDLLRLEISDLSDLDFDLLETGFDQDEIDQMLALGGAGGGLTDEDEAPEPPADPTTKAGDLWVLGKHRLLCGDCTVATDVARLLGDVEPHLMVTDPPYGVNYDADWRNHAMRSTGAAVGGRAIGVVANDDRADWRDAWALFPGDVVYIWHAGQHASVVHESLLACGFEVRSQIIWAKNNIVISRGHYHPKHEPCWYAVRKGKSGHWSGDRKQSTLWNIDKPMKSETGHSTQKPVECMRRPMENNSNPGHVVYDPFVGSGTSIIAAESIGRFCYAMEVEPAYCDVTIKRWEDYTGEKAVLEKRQDAA